MFGLNIRDIDCAFKLFHRNVYDLTKPIISTGAMFSAEFLIKAITKGFVIKEVPVSHYPRKYGSQSGAKLKVILKMFKESWRLKY